MDEKGRPVKLRKAGYIPVSEIQQDEYLTLLPEKYLRPYEPHFVNEEEFENEFESIEAEYRKMAEGLEKRLWLKPATRERHTPMQAENIPVKDVIGYISGNSGLTEEFLYNNIEAGGVRYTILSSATKGENKLGEIPMCMIHGKPLKVFEDKEGLLVIRKGKAGKTYFLKPGKYTLNDDAYILYVKDDCPYAINLKWLSIRYRRDFMAYASSADNGTWNMTGFFNNVFIDIPSIYEQEKLVALYERAEELKAKMEKINEKIGILLNKEIS